MNPSASLSREEAANPVLDDLIAAITDRLQAGEAVDVEVYAAEHPDLAAELRHLLPALQLMAAVGSESSSGGEHREPSLHGELGDFRLLREVGRGGMGIVYEAEQISLKRRVALKVLPFAATMDPRHLQRFHNEAQAAACLHHTNIVPVHFVGSERGVHFYAMQFIDGRPLSDVIRQQQEAEKKTPAAAGEVRTAAHQPSVGDATPPPAADMTPLTSEGRRGRDYFRKVAELGIQAAEALDHAHQLGIVHRDIKPANLLLDARGNLWVADFGLAHIQHNEANLTTTGQAVGTPRYMSPEQALAKRVPIDHRTDVYSLGATLYELLTLRPAFESTDRQELLRQIAWEEPARPRRLERAIPAELEIIVLKAMEKWPQDRYATAKEAAEDLRHWLEDKPIKARRPTLVQRTRRLVRRHKSATAAITVVLLMAFLLTGYIVWTRHDSTMRREASEKVILAAVKDSQDFQKQGRLPEALSAARRADGLLAGADVDEALRQQVRARRNDLELLDKLFHVRLEELTKVERGRYDKKSADARYGQTFQEAGLDVETLSAQEVGEQIRQSTVAVELAAELDNWAMLRVLLRGPDDPSWRHLLGVARVADPDSLRTRVRDTLELRDAEALRKLAASEEVFRLPPATLSILGLVFSMDKPASTQAEKFLRKAQKLYPNDFWINDHLFSLLLAMGRPAQIDEAIRFATVTTALRPDSPGPHLNLALALSQNGKEEEAIVEYREAIRIQNDLAGAHNNLGALLMRKDRIDDAIVEFREAIRIEPDHAGAHSNLGNALKTKGQLEESFRELREAVRVDNNSVAAHVNYAVACAERGQMDEAIVEFRRAIQLDNDNATAHMNLGNCLEAKGRFAEAIKEYRAAIQLQNDEPKAHYNLGHALSSRGQLDEAIAEFRKAIQIDKNHADAHCMLGRALTFKGRLDEAIDEYRKALSLKKSPIAHCGLGNALRKKGRLDEAIAEFRQSISLDDRFAHGHYHLGNALHDKGQLDEAIDQLRGAVRLNKDFADAHRELGNALHHHGRFDEAITEYREAIRINKDDAEAQCMVGLVLCDQGKYRQAVEVLRHGHDLGSRQAGWRCPSAQWLRDAQNLANLDARLPALLNGQKQPGDARDCLNLAQLCQLPCKKRYSGAVRFYGNAFEKDPKMADDLNAQHRYSAACAAALAGCGQGKDADKLDSKEHARLRQQALDWLRADLKAYQQVMEKSAGKAGPEIGRRMAHWLRDSDFAGVRGAESLAKMPEAERLLWQKLWQDVEALKRQAAETPKSADNGNQRQRKEGSPSKD